MTTKNTTAAATTDEGFIDIPLRKPLIIDGTKVLSLRMREPLVEDQLAVHGAGTDAEQELSLIANLCMIDPASLKKMPLRDYANVRTALVGFID